MLGLQLRPRDQTAVFSVKYSKISKTEEGEVGNYGSEQERVCGIVNREFVPRSQTTNAEFYCSVLWHLRKDIRRKQPELRRDDNWVIYHDNSPAHSALKGRAFSVAKTRSFPLIRQIWLPETSSYSLR